MIACKTRPVEEQALVGEEPLPAESHDGESDPVVSAPLSLLLNRLLDPGQHSKEPVSPPPIPTVPEAPGEPAQADGTWQRARSGAVKTWHAVTLHRPKRQAKPFATTAGSTPPIARAKPPARPLREQVGNARQKIMMVMIPVLALALVFLLKNPLKSTSAAQTPSAAANPAAPLAAADIEIAWEIPAPYQPGGRDPMRLPAPPTAETVEESVPSPVQTHVELAVTGILYSEDRPSAIVDTHLVREGQQVSGATVKKIDAGGVEFEMNGQTWRQTVDRR